MNTKRYRELQGVADRLALVFEGAGRLRRYVRKASRKDVADLARLQSWWSPNIAGFGLGGKEAGGKRSRYISVRLYVYQKVHPSRLRREERIPQRIHLDHLEEQILTDVEPIAGEPVLHAPLPAGSEVGHFSGSVGTTSCYVQKSGSTIPLLLSCAHVLAPFQAVLDDQIESPVDHNSSTADNPVGHLFPGSIILHANATHPTDAAIAELLPEMVGSNNALGVGRITSMLLTPQSLAGMPVEMRGSATGTVVRGQVSPDALATMKFRLRGQDYKVQNLLRYDISAREGDSGAAVVQLGTGKMIGIHVGAEQGTTRAFLAPSWVISSELGVSLSPI